MARSKWKLPYLSKSLLRNILIIKIFRTKFKNAVLSRSSTIPFCLNPNKWYVHSGLIFVKVKINKFMIGQKFGEFALTRKFFFFPKKDPKKTKMIRR